MIFAVWMGAANEGVETLDAVDQALLEQEVERAVYRWRRHALASAVFRQRFQDLIGAAWLVARPDQLQHPSADRSQPGATRRAKLLRLSERAFHTAPVVVFFTDKRHEVSCLSVI